jgi:dihydroxy-acid dehydratase
VTGLGPITACGIALLYVSPESYAGGVLALVENVDIIEVDVKTGDSI